MKTSIQWFFAQSFIRTGIGCNVYGFSYSIFGKREYSPETAKLLLNYVKIQNAYGKIITYK